jgi:hypothetical protein
MSDHLHDNPFIEAEPYVGRALEASRSQPIASSNGRPEAEPSASVEWTVGYHIPTVRMLLNVLRRHMADGQRAGLKVGTLREAIEGIEYFIKDCPGSAK